MEEILKKANELGLMIKHTEVCINFERLTREIELNEDASSLLKKYNETAETIQAKRESGDIIEKYEQEMFRALTETVKENILLVEYLTARDQYIDLLMKIHNSMNGTM